jgi:hypothetical protein
MGSWSALMPDARRKEDTLTDLRYSDGIAAARTMIVLEANPTALQRRLPTGWELEELTFPDPSVYWYHPHIWED